MNHTTKRIPVPRGIARSGPVIFSYGFRPFFLAAGLWGIAAMALWIGALAAGWEIGGSYGGPYWHAHEMLFGYSSAALAGFLLTAVPNWTGRLPVSGTPLVVLFAVWCAGRLALLAPDVLGLVPSIVIDAAFLPLLLATCAREIIAGRKWKDLKILAGILALAIANIGFHLLIASGGDAGFANRLGVGAFVMLVSIMGGRVVPSFTRNWLVKRHAIDLPIPYNRFDTVALLAGLAALALWVALPGTIWTALACLVAGALHLVRLWRWRGWQSWDEKLVLVLHVGYAFVPLGFLAIAAAQLGWTEPVASLHVFTVGAIGVMTLAIMSRATRGHTGLPLAASRVTASSYAALILAVLLRPLASVWPDYYTELLSATGLCWIVAFTLYVAEYGPVLVRKRRDRPE
ncbi:NnrS family protein [Devosia ginsengisoli]|uniref:NnrS family protein n=1 Tax=Devosia ginsengisoli TaxID=400770 RepID=UPI0026EEFBE7|nr:NnrS family protein [Devosia ginsengisoli]MCR6670564.1 NnrS family protein [Devosia ginsengisoli]